MDVFQIEGPVRLAGHVDVNGSKNASLPIMAAALLAPGCSTLIGVPQLADISVFRKLIDQLGCRVERQEDGALVIDATKIENPVGPYDIVRQMRASVCILGPLLARCSAPRM
jgi:UDP-N-acetylglucosamine 1-carboxyvinyltransferase